MNNNSVICCENIIELSKLMRVGIYISCNQKNEGNNNNNTNINQTTTFYTNNVSEFTVLTEYCEQQQAKLNMDNNNNKNNNALIIGVVVVTVFIIYKRRQEKSNLLGGVSAQAFVMGNCKLEDESNTYDAKNNGAYCTPLHDDSNYSSVEKEEEVLGKDVKNSYDPIRTSLNPYCAFDPTALICGKGVESNAVVDPAYNNLPSTEPIIIQQPADEYSNLAPANCNLNSNPNNDYIAVDKNDEYSSHTTH
eukprot:Pgem_evm1s11004